MNNLKRLLTQPLAEVGSVVLGIFLLVAIIGFADASYLTVEHYLGVVPPCTLEQGCEVVLTSNYSVLFGVPTSLLGALYYLAVATGAFFYLESKHGQGKVAAHHSAILRWTLMATALGFGMSLWFVYLQLFILHSICVYCMGSATSSTILFLLALWMLHKHTSQNHEQEN